mgnify:CR=1 FL=1
MDLDLPDFKDTKSFTVGLRELIYSFSAVYPTAKIAETVFTQPRSKAAISPSGVLIAAIQRLEGRTNAVTLAAIFYASTETPIADRRLAVRGNRCGQSARSWAAWL